MRPSWYYQRQQQEAAAREAYRASYAGPPQGTTIESRGTATTAYYRSLLLQDGTDPLIFSTSVPAATLALLPATDAGLLLTLGTTDVSQRLRGSGVKPTKVSWYQGDPTPRYESSPWNTRYARYYSAGTHKSSPFSKATGTLEANDLRTRFNTLFGEGGTRRSLLGAINGRASITFERANLGQTT
jgi:hypothetical protein